jgi:hypothetical protein
MRYAASSSDKPSGGYELVDEFYDAAVSGADAERGIVNERGVPFSGVWLCEYPGLSFQRCPVRACSLVDPLIKQELLDLAATCEEVANDIEDRQPGG